ncbi:hypothetical protein AB0L53_06445 [Nonomuraea sp. NPDC052129]|uniref:hypothetical protein n=1 Tax=unclassified Nonomuraea TaxID=2593643 RepID=UPI003416AC24
MTRETHYRDLLETEQWLGSGLSWTVVRPVAGAIGPAQVAARLTGGGRPEIRELDVQDTELDGFHVLFVDTVGDGVMLFERWGGGYEDRPEVLGWLSEDAYVWNLGWHAGGGERIIHAVPGRSGYETVDLTDSGAYSGALGPGVERVRAASGWARKAAAMALVEELTGARLDREWLTGARTAVLIDTPTSAGPLEPLGLEHVEPELERRLRALDAAGRRAVLIAVAGELAARFQLWDEPVEEALRADGPLGAEVRDGLLLMHAPLLRDWMDSNGGFPREGDELWQRWVASLAVRHALLNPDDGLHSLTYARRALGPEWLHRTIPERDS